MPVGSFAVMSSDDKYAAASPYSQGDLVDLLFLRIPFLLREVLIIAGEFVHRSAEEAHQSRAHGVEPLRSLEELRNRANDAT
jgi:hypothetical protein